MLDGLSCTRLGLLGHSRVPYGDEREGWRRFGLTPSKKRCHDCGTPPGGIHHFGCDSEVCPIDGEQIITCMHAERFDVGT
jgi:hypothetical protein